MSIGPRIHQFVQEWRDNPESPDPLQRLMNYWLFRAQFAEDEFGEEHVARRDRKLAEELRQLLVALLEVSVTKAEAVDISTYSRGTLDNKTSRMGGKDPEIPTINGRIALAHLPVDGRTPMYQAVAAVQKINAVRDEKRTDELAAKRAEEQKTPRQQELKEKAERAALRAGRLANAR
jgi:hypothetical protein